MGTVQEFIRKLERDLRGKDRWVSGLQLKYIEK